MLYQTFNSIKEAFGPDYFTDRISNEIVQNLNSKFELREYQKEALGRFDFVTVHGVAENHDGATAITEKTGR